MNTLTSAPSPSLNKLPAPKSNTPPATIEAPSAPEPQDSIDKPSTLYEVGASTVGVMAGLASGITRLIVGGCAGAAQGVVRSIKLQEQQTEMAFKAAMGANLALTGALAGGVGGLDFLQLSPSTGALAGAATNVMVGNNEWNRQPGQFQDAVKTTANEWLEQSLAKFPGIKEADTPLKKVACATVGEFVGLAAGVVTGAKMMGTNFEAGYHWGRTSFDSAANYFAPEVPSNESK